MSAVVGIDLSSHALDLVKLNECDSRAEWVRCELTGGNAWERTLMLCDSFDDIRTSEFFDDVYLVAIEEPYGRGQPGTTAKLNRVVGALLMELPWKLRVPERCWIVRPDEWKRGLGLKGKPDNAWFFEHGFGGFGYVDWPQDAKDAYCLAMFARDENAKAVAAALLASPLPAAEENP